MASVPDKALDPDIHKKVRRGRIDIDGKIDLHGMTQVEAREALYRYIVTRASYGARTILVITGKGIKTDNDYISAMSERGILRTMLPIWLSEPGLAHLVSGAWPLAATVVRGRGMCAYAAYDAARDKTSGYAGSTWHFIERNGDGAQCIERLSLGSRARQAWRADELPSSPHHRLFQCDLG
jgi:hypothetical protein